MSDEEVRDALLRLYDRSRVVGQQQAMRDKFIAACTALDELKKMEDKRGTRS